MTDKENHVQECGCECHGHGSAFQPACSVPGGCGHLHRAEPSGRCRCGGPCPDGYLCNECMGEMVTDLTALQSFLPELGTLLTRQSNARRRVPRIVTVEVKAAEPAVFASPAAAWLRSGRSEIGLVANPLPFDVAASELLSAAHVLVFGWVRDVRNRQGVERKETVA